MRIKIEGKTDLDFLPTRIEKVMEKLAADGVAYVSGINLYVTLHNSDGHEVGLADETGREIPYLVLTDPNKSIKKTKTDKVIRQKPQLRAVS